MRILFIIDYFQNQLGYSESYIVKSMIKAGHIVQILTSDRYYPFPDFKDTVGKMLGNRIVGSGDFIEDYMLLKRTSIYFEIFTRTCFKEFSPVINSFKPDIVIINGITTLNAVRAALNKDKYKFKLICTDSHLPSEFYRGNVFIKKIFYFLFRILFSHYLEKKVDKFIAVQDKTIEIINTFYGIKDKVELIDLGTDPNIFRFDQESREKIRDEYKIDKNDFVLIYTGKFIKAKGIDILFKAFNQLNNKYKDIKMLLLGSGNNEYVNECLKFVNSNFHKNIYFLGFKNNQELYKYYSVADLAIWPLQESTAMNDAAACSLPFIVNNTIGAKTRISNDNALLYKIYDFQDLADKIEMLYLDRDKCKKMGIKGRELVENKLSWDAIAEKYLKID